MHYSLIKSRIDYIAKVPGIFNWVNWWHARKSKKCPAFRIYGLSKVNLAEQGNSTLRHQHTLMLVDAANDDVTTIFIQEDEYKQFMDSNGASSVLV